MTNDLDPHQNALCFGQGFGKLGSPKTAHPLFSLHNLARSPFITSRITLLDSTTDGGAADL